MFIQSMLTMLLAVVPASANEHLVYALPTALHAVVAYVTLDKGFFKEEGLDVEGKMFASGREALQMLLAGQAQIQSVSETPIVHAIIQGNKIVTIATQSRQTEPKFIGRKDHGISTPTDIRGKKIAVTPGTNADYYMHVFLEHYGIPLSQVKIANMWPPEMVTSFVQGDIDGFFSWQPHIYYAQRLVREQSIVIPPGDLYVGRDTVNMNADYVKAHPETVRKIIRALLKGSDFVATHHDEALDIVAKRLDMERAVLADIWNENSYQVELDPGFPVLMEKIGRWAIGLEAKDKPLPNFRSFIYTEALAKERPSVMKL